MAESRLARLWAHRAFAEAEAQAQYIRLARTLARLDPNSPFVFDLVDASRDEARHAALCHARAVACGWTHPPAATAAVWNADQRTTRATFDLELVATFCVGESLNAVLLQEELQRVVGAERSLTRELLRDEVRHARLGWRYLADRARSTNVPSLGGPLKKVLEEALSRGAHHPAPAALAAPEREALLERGLREVVLPGLRRYGLIPEGIALRAA